VNAGGLVENANYQASKRPCDFTTVCSGCGSPGGACRCSQMIVNQRVEPVENSGDFLDIPATMDVIANQRRAELRSLRRRQRLLNNAHVPLDDDEDDEDEDEEDADRDSDILDLLLGRNVHVGLFRKNQSGQKAQGSNADLVGSGGSMRAGRADYPRSDDPRRIGDRASDDPYWLPGQTSQADLRRLVSDETAGLAQSTYDEIMKGIADSHNTTPEVIDGIVSEFRKMRTATLRRVT